MKLEKKTKDLIIKCLSDVRERTYGDIGNLLNLSDEELVRELNEHFPGHLLEVATKQLYGDIMEKFIKTKTDTGFLISLNPEFYGVSNHEEFIMDSSVGELYFPKDSTDPEFNAYVQAAEVLANGVVFGLNSGLSSRTKAIREITEHNFNFEHGEYSVAYID